MYPKKQGIFDFTDFRGGYFTDLPSEEMKDNELLRAENCYWRNGLEKRLGKASYVSLTGANLRGGIRAKIASVWYTILGVEATAAAVELKIGTDTAFTTLSMASATAYTLQNGYDIQFAVLDEQVVAVNGYNKPSVIWASGSTIQVDTVERRDTRDMNNDNWYAGVYIESSTSYADDTTDAQSAASMDFTLAASTTGTAGFWVACDNVFNQVTLKDVSAVSTNSMTFEYFGRATSAASQTWVTFTPVNAVTWTAVGNKTIEMDLPFDTNTNEMLMDNFGSSTYNIADRYCMRFRTGTAVSVTWAAASVELKHTQYLSQLLLGDKPDTVATHKNHLFMGMGNWIRYSPYNQVVGWREADKGYFSEGGYIQSMIPHLDYLAVMQESAIHGILGNSWQNFSEKLLASGKGPINKRSAAVVNDEIYFVARDGIYGWNGTRLLKVSKHIRSDIDGYTLTNACALAYKGEYWVSFPTNSITLIFDPDSIRMDDMGDGRVSFYKFTPYQVHQFLDYAGAGDTGFLYGIVNATVPRLDRLETDNFDKITSSSTIAMAVQSRYHDFGNFLQPKTFKRLKPMVKDSTSTAGANYTVKMYRLNRYGTASASSVITASVSASGIHTEDLSIPGNMDGNVLSIYVGHDSQNAAKLYGYSVEVARRAY